MLFVLTPAFRRRKVGARSFSSKERNRPLGYVRAHTLFAYSHTVREELEFDLLQSADLRSVSRGAQICSRSDLINDSEGNKSVPEEIPAVSACSDRRGDISDQALNCFPV